MYIFNWKIIMKTNFAKTISIIFYPSLVLCIALIISVYPNFNLTLLSLAFGLIIPIILSVVYFYKVKMPETWVVPREYRYFPLLISILSNAFLLYFFEKEDHLAQYITCLSISVTFICFIVTFYWKISLHMAGMGAIAGFFFLNHSSSIVQISWLLACITTAWARMFLKSHDIWQVLAGYFSAFALAFICMKVLGT